MQAIILAAGMGKRLGELTRENTKCMVRVNGVCLIDRLLIQLSTLGLERIILVIGYQGDKLRAHVGENYLGTPIEYIENEVYDKTNNIYSLFLAREELQKQDTLLIESDLIFDDALFQKIINNPSPNLALVAKYEPWMDGTMVRLGEDNDIVEFISKKAFRYEDISHYYKTVNIYKFSREFLHRHYVPFLEAYSKALAHNEYYEQVLRVITLLDNCELKGLPLDGENWYEIDDAQDLDIAETLFADENRLQRYHQRYGGYWRFPKLKDFCYLVNPYFPPQKMREELKANFDTLLTEYPSGQQVNSLLMAKNYGLSPDLVVTGNGAAELIKSLMEHTDGYIGLTLPTLEEYPTRTDRARLEPFIPQFADLAYTADDLIAFYGTHPVETLLLINPDNPSGNFIPADGLRKLMDWTRERGIRFILDESFVDFATDGRAHSMLHNEVLRENPQLVVVRSISKSYGVPGLRLGLIASADHELIARTRRDVSIWNINSFAEFYLQIFSKYETDYDEACHRIAAERDRFGLALAAVDWLRVVPSQANYFLCEVTARFTAAQLTDTLLRRYNILIKDCSTKSALGGRNYVRIAVRDRADNDALIHALLSLTDEPENA